MMPMGAFNAPISFTGDLILFAYLLALGRFFTTAAALDTGSPFEGMGAAREVTFACLAEPALFFAVLVLAKISNSLSLSTMLHGPLLGAWAVSGPPLLLVLAGLFIVLLAENARIPVDDPNTHLELTMIHEVMVLDHSGPLLGLIEYAAAMKLLVLGALVTRVAIPFESGRFVIDWIAFIAQMIGLAIAIGVVESVMARLRMKQVPNLLIAACLLAGFGFLLLVR
jgi:formate hydrogenlyase subunit 4